MELKLGKEFTTRLQIIALCQTNIDVSQATTIYNKNKLYGCLSSPLALPFHFLPDLRMHSCASLALCFPEVKSVHI